MVRLTQFSHGAGCGCKISPAVLETILQSDLPRTSFPSLLVGNESKDDAAVFDLGDGTCIVSTTDFFMPIVDDPFTFGSIASVNAISDIYAMGGKPVMAIAILGWPIDKIPAQVAKIVLEGSRKVCADAGIPLAGGHTIDCPEPLFGLAVTGVVQRAHLKKNNTARKNSRLYLTKPLGVGIITTAQKKGIVTPEHIMSATDSMLALNSLGEKLGLLAYVNALTDVTGFGLLGHLCELGEGSGLSARITFQDVPRFDFLESYVEQKCIPGGTGRNWASYGHKIGPLSEFQKAVLADPQTSGGLLISVDGDRWQEFEEFAGNQGMALRSIGKLVPQEEIVVTIN